MIYRPLPADEVIYGFCKGVQGLLQSIHHGAIETPIDKLYPVLNFDEAALFLAKSWLFRKKTPLAMRTMLEFSSMPMIFSEMVDQGYSWQRSYGVLPDEVNAGLAPLNPFEHLTLLDRLSSVKEEDWQELKGKLWKKVHEYVFRCHYYGRLAERCGNKRGLENMTFLDCFPSKKTNSIKFSQELARIFSKYPAGYEPFIKPAPAPSLNV